MPAHPALTMSARALVGSLSWHWVFYVNLPLGAVALAVAARTLPAHTTRVAHRIPSRHFYKRITRASGMLDAVLVLTKAAQAAAFADQHRASKRSRAR